MLRPYQQAAVTAAINWIKYKDDPAILWLPTGAGKTHVIKGIIERSPGRKVLVLAHRKELLEQCGAKLDGDFGYYSASIGEKDASKDITIASVQTIARSSLAGFDLIIVDECHRMGNKQVGQYWSIINANPKAKVLGLTATPFRLKENMLDWGEIVYRVGYPELIKHGYLTPIKSKLSHQPDLSAIKVKSTGDYNDEEIEDIMTDPALLDESVKRIMAYGKERKSALIFCTSIKHCELIHSTLWANGISSEVVTGSTNKSDRELILKGFKEGRIKYLINCEVLTTGFDAPNIDLVVCLRPTMSKALFEQIAGRAVRLCEGKKDALLIDMGGNLCKHGPIGSPIFEKSADAPEKAPGKICPSCEEYVAFSQKICPDCDFEWPEPEAPKVSHEYSEALVDNATFVPAQWYDVVDVMYMKTSTKKGDVCIKAKFFVEGYSYRTIDVYNLVHHEKEFLRRKAWQFFKELGDEIYINKGCLKDYSAEDLLWRAQNNLRKPKRVYVDLSKQFPEIKQYDMGDSTEDILDDEI